MTRITIADMKLMKSGAVGQVICSGVNRYVVIAEVPRGVQVVCLKGTVMGDPDEVLVAENDKEVTLENREDFKRRFSDRWAEIAEKYPGIG